MDGVTTARLDGWLVRLRDGDSRAFDEMLGHFGGRLERLASRMLGGFPSVAAREETGDVLQEGLLRLHKGLKALMVNEGTPAGSRTLHGPDLLRFAATQIRRELLDLAKRHARKPTAALPGVDEVDGDARPDVGPATWNPEAISRWTEFHSQAALLPGEIREVFDLIYYNGLTQEEVAAQTGVSTQTIKTRWRDARLRLADACGGGLPGL